MSLWELQAAVEGWKRANSPEEKPRAPTDELFEEQMAKYADV